MKLILAAGSIRAAVTGFVGVGLGLYLAQAGVGAGALGLIVGLGLAGNAVATAVVAFKGDRWDRRQLLLWTSILAAAGLVAAALFPTAVPLAVAAFVGMLNGMGRDRGPAQALEQSLLAEPTSSRERTRAYVSYAMAQDVAGAVGGLGAGAPALLGMLGVAAARAWQVSFLAAAALTLGTTVLYLFLPRATPVAGAETGPVRVSPESRRRVTGLAALFSLDSLGGGFLATSILAYWFYRRFGLTGAELGPLFMAGRLLNVASYAVAGWLAARIGLLRTMVFTHLPSSLVLLLLPFVQTPWQAVAIFLLRESLVQMDVPTRQAYVTLVTQPGERTFAIGITNLTRNVGWALGPTAAGAAMGALGLGAPLVIGAGLKIVYDLALYRSFRHLPGHET